MHSQTRLPYNDLSKEPLEIEVEDEDDEDLRTIFCANIDSRVTEEILYEVFLQAGPIESVRIPKDNGGRQKTFGFVTYVHKCSVPYALQLLNGLSLFRKNLTIKTKLVQSLPSDCEPLHRRSGGGRDNSALRGNNFSCDGDNPFKRSPPSRVEWTSNRRSDDNMKKHLSQNNRPHQNTPYSRVDPSRDHSGGNHHNRHNTNRRSEQRNPNRRR